MSFTQILRKNLHGFSYPIFTHVSYAVPQSVYSVISDAPDILMDVNAMQSSIKINSWHLHHLSCSKSENCLTRTAYEGDAYVNPKKNYRRLMVFTSLILNKGTAAFRPNRHKDQWEWHQCHRHFHSMEYFAQYDVIGNAIDVLVLLHVYLIVGLLHVFVYPLTSLDLAQGLLTRLCKHADV